MKRDYMRGNKTPRDEEYIDAYLKTHSQSKAAELCGVSRETVARAVRRADIPMNGRKSNKEKPEPHHKQCIVCGSEFDTFRNARKTCSHECAWKYKHPGNKKETNWNWVNEKQPNFLFVSKNKKRISLQCKNCGNVIERAESTVRQKNVKCEYCKEFEELANARIKLINVLVALEDSKTLKICKNCGKGFYSTYPTQKYCSKQCKSLPKKHISRAKRYGVEYEHGITLQRVIERDHNVCQICGKVCDKNDKRWGTSGPTYPTIDHIIPLAKGGSHKWNNIQLAHGLCNSTKRDLIND